MPTIITVMREDDVLVVTVEKDRLGRKARGGIHAYPSEQAALAHEDHEDHRIGTWYSDAGVPLEGMGKVAPGDAVGMALVASQEGDGGQRTWSNPYVVPGVG